MEHKTKTRKLTSNPNTTTNNASNNKGIDIDDDDYDSENDSDYRPEDDPVSDGDDNDDEDDDNKKGTQLQDITTHRKRKAYDLFDELKQQDELDTITKMKKAFILKPKSTTGHNDGSIVRVSKSVVDDDKTHGNEDNSSKAVKKIKLISKKQRQDIQKYNDMLISVFGKDAVLLKKPKSAVIEKTKTRKSADIHIPLSSDLDVVSNSDIIRSSVSNSSNMLVVDDTGSSDPSSTTNEQDGAIKRSDGKEDKVDSELRNEALEVAKRLLKKTRVVEIKKFAGRDIKITTTSLAPSSSTDSSKITDKPIIAPSTSNLDSVLESLKGPKVISTVGKSSVDWDNFKEEEGLEDTLMHAGKDGYLAKQEFLDRCDYRAFEKERDQRLVQAAVRANQT